jgi:ABC-type transport system involved in cytochrome c biogenesis permease subunit
MKIKNLIILLVFLFTAQGIVLAKDKPAQNEESSIRLNEFGKVAILDEGRVKPVETYARTVLLQFSGKRTFNKKPATNWLAKLLFTPWATAEDKVFLINSPEIPQAINITPDPHRRYSFAQLENGLMKFRELAIAADAIDQKERSVVEQEILRVYNNLSLYLKLRNSFSFTIPNDEFSIENQTIKTALDFPATKNSFSFLDIALTADRLNEETKPLEKKKSEQWTADEKDFMRLLRNLYQWSLNASEKENGMVILPLSADQEIWISPWEMTHHNFADPQVRQQLALIQKMSDAYRNNAQLDFDISTKALNLAIEKQVPFKQVKSYHKIPLEIFYNHSNLFRLAWICYFLAFFTFLFSLIWPQPILHRFGLSFLILGFIPHLLAMVMRIVIMSRPPVTNLYETFIFVGVVCVILSLITELFNKNWLGIVVGSFCGFAALAIADKFSAEGDTMRMLVAVLDSNFWLSTHVLTITIGYAGCSVAAIMGHVYVLQALFNGNRPEQLKTTYRYILGILGFGLTTAFLGTMLGGIWADQSWGRFWGWDPKENGALLIVIWSAIIFHAKLGRMINPLGVAVGAALGLIVVMWAWFGVNLLSIGLHSYGFTSGLATNLGIFLACELIFLGVSVIILGKRGIPI